MAVSGLFDGQGSYGGDFIGRNPTDRGKQGTKRSVLTDGEGGPLSVAIAGANVVDQQMLKATLEYIVVERPEVTTEQPQHLCGDKGYDNPTTRAALEGTGYTSHIKRIGQEKVDEQGNKTHPARRWVIERTFAWLSRCRAILVRYEKKGANYLGLLCLACSLLWYRRLHRLTVLR